ncbi:MAG: S-layer protein [Candidatus Aenigmatarchaeota archaeon]
MQRLGKILTAGALGAMLLGATVALPATLADYPSPFVEDGKVNTLVVVGANAATADVVGAIDLAARLAGEVGLEGTCPACPGVAGAITVTGGVQITHDLNKLYLGEEFDTVKSLITGNDLPDLLGTKTFTDKEGNVVTYYEQIILGNHYVTYGRPTDFDKPELYVEFPTAEKYKLKAIFVGGLDTSKVDSSYSIKLFGKEYTFGSGTDLSADTIELYSSTGATSVALTGVGDTETVTVGGKTLTFEVKGWDPQNTNKAYLYVNGKATSPYGWVEGSTYTVEGVKVYVNDVSVIRTGAQEETVSVLLFVGTDKLVLKDGQAVEKNDEALSGTSVTIHKSGTKLNSLEIEVVPDTTKYLKDGSTFVDPVFGSFRFSLNGMTPSLTSDSRDLVKIEESGTRKVKLTFTNKEGTAYSFDAFYLDTNNNCKLSHDGTKNIYVVENNMDLKVGEYVVLTAGDATYIYRLSALTTTGNNPYATFVDIATGSSQKVYYNSDPYIYIGENKFKVQYDNNKLQVSLNGDEDFTDTDAVPLYTKTGGIIDISHCDDANNADFITFSESKLYSLGNDPADGALKITVAYASNDVNFNIAYEEGDDQNFDETLLGGQVGTSDVYNYLTKYGTFVTHDTNADKINIYYPGNRPAYALVAVGSNPVWSTTEAVGPTPAVSYKTAVPVTTALAKLDSEVTQADRNEKHLILVGGPCANALVAELAAAGKFNYEGAPLTCDAWNARTYAGDVFGLIQLVDNAFATGKVALVVAGSRAEQTRWATSILQKYDVYNLRGTAVKVPSLNTIEVIS